MANNVSNLARSEIRDAGLKAFKRGLIALSGIFSVAFSAAVNENSMAVYVPYVPRDTVDAVTRAAGDSLIAIAGDTNKTGKLVTIQDPLVKAIAYNDIERSRNRFLDPAQAAEKAVEALLWTVVKDVMGLFTSANYASTGITLDAVEDFSTVETNALQALCDDAHWPEQMRHLILSTGLNQALADNVPGYTLSAIGDEIFTTGQTAQISGFMRKKFPSLPTNSEGVKGIACLPSAALIGFTTITPPPAVLDQMYDYAELTDPETGISLTFKHVANADTGKEAMAFEVSHGKGVGEADAAKLIKLA